ncbi:hypothetical protein [Panacagrimonas perspica]|uniref:hypothetical protein n=1 Tax=Panacagrimonas perspica TaxID=381431 RepID=UPI0010603A04|nr:hypothetical protein [Panacagrimonas perspica]
MRFLTSKIEVIYLERSGAGKTLRFWTGILGDSMRHGCTDRARRTLEVATLIDVGGGPHPSRRPAPTARRLDATPPAMEKTACRP